MSANRFTEFPPRRDPNPVCFYCGEGFEDDVHVEWQGYYPAGWRKTLGPHIT